jgi:hypothetical protein
VSRRKGELPIVKTVRDYTPGHPVAKMIATGDFWVNAWIVQMTTPWTIIAKRTGIKERRLRAFEAGSVPSPAEIDGLAALWHVPPEGLRQSIDSSNALRLAQS